MSTKKRLAISLSTSGAALGLAALLTGFSDRAQAQGCVQSRGLGDVSARLNGWVFDPHKHMDGNLQLGAGMKFPTGDSRARDVFERRVSGQIIAVQDYVDQSIQPGDGGWGVILQAQGFQKIVKNTYGYIDASYLINPQEK